MATSTRPDGGVPSWHEDSIYSETIAIPDDVIYIGSDDEHYNTPDERRQRYIEAGFRYLQGKRSILLSSALNGPFDAHDKWRNPWSSTREDASKSGHDVAASKETNRVTKASGVSVNKLDAATHLPSPESLKQASSAPTPRKRPTEPEIGFSNQHNLESAGTRTRQAAVSKRKAESSEWLKTLPEKRQKPIPLSRGESLPDLAAASRQCRARNSLHPSSSQHVIGNGRRTGSQTEAALLPRYRKTQSFDDETRGSPRLITTPTSLKRKTPPSRRRWLEDESGDELSQDMPAISPCSNIRQARTMSKRAKPPSARPSAVLGTKTSDESRGPPQRIVSNSAPAAAATRPATRSLTRSRVETLPIQHSSPCRGPAKRAEDRVDTATPDDVEAGGSTEEPQTEEPQTEDPQTEDPQTEDPQTEDPQMGAPQIEKPHVQESGQVSDRPKEMCEDVDSRLAVVETADDGYQSSSDLSDLNSDFDSETAEWFSTPVCGDLDTPDISDTEEGSMDTAHEQQPDQQSTETAEAPAEAAPRALHCANRNVEAAVDKIADRRCVVEQTRPNEALQLLQAPVDDGIVMSSAAVAANMDVASSHVSTSSTGTTISLTGCIRDGQASSHFSFTSLLPSLVASNPFHRLGELIRRPQSEASRSGFVIEDVGTKGDTQATAIDIVKPDPTLSISMAEAESPVASIEEGDASERHLDTRMEVCRSPSIEAKEEVVDVDISEAEPLAVTVAEAQQMPGDDTQGLHGSETTAGANPTMVEAVGVNDVSMHTPPLNTTSTAQESASDVSMNDKSVPAEDASRVDAQMFTPSLEAMSIAQESAVDITMNAEPNNQPVAVHEAESIARGANLSLQELDSSNTTFDSTTVSSDLQPRVLRQSTPEPHFSFKSISCFISPSPRKKRPSRYPASRRAGAGVCTSNGTILKPALKGQGHAKTQHRVTWASLPEQHIFDAQARIRRGSPPPETLGEVRLAGDDLFKHHFDAVAKKTSKRGLQESTTISTHNDDAGTVADQHSTPSPSAELDEDVRMSTIMQQEDPARIQTALDGQQGGDMEMDTQDFLDDVLEEMEGLLDTWDVEQELDKARSTDTGFGVAHEH